jgi:hypothetical protein
MQTRKRRIETISETTTLFILKNSAKSTRQGWCEQCLAETLWIASTEIGLLGISDIPEDCPVHRNFGRVCSRSLIEEIRKGEN